MKYVKEFVKLAKSDLKSSVVLYENKCYPQSIFFFAQSVEKANKALALSSGKFDEESMLEIRHDPMEIYKRMLIDQKEKYQRSAKLLNHIPEINEIFSLIEISPEENIVHCENGLREIGKMQKSKRNPYFLSTREINDIFQSVSELEISIKKSIESLDQSSIDLKQWKDNINQLVSNFEKCEYIDKEQLGSVNI
ncbi:HEPN domain-containing protein [Methanohalophilus halophilus]|nr:HEPN domain-containing protein [Methanohalophilus halophilus]APH38228.1 hypothetical protein BHR79_01165 [Methanohalophilus halophilus]SDV99833.1 HEPN domain-containing protein [Methanohalophilus halophilus]